MELIELEPTRTDVCANCKHLLIDISDGYRYYCRKGGTIGRDRIGTYRHTCNEWLWAGEKERPQQLIQLEIF